MAAQPRWLSAPARWRSSEMPDRARHRRFTRRRGAEPRHCIWDASRASPSNAPLESLGMESLDRAVRLAPMSTEDTPGPNNELSSAQLRTVRVALDVGYVQGATPDFVDTRGSEIAATVQYTARERHLRRGDDQARADAPVALSGRERRPRSRGHPPRRSEHGVRPRRSHDLSDRLRGGPATERDHGVQRMKIKVGDAKMRAALDAKRAQIEAIASSLGERYSVRLAMPDADADHLRWFDGGVPRTSPRDRCSRSRRTCARRRSKRSLSACAWTSHRLVASTNCSRSRRARRRCARCGYSASR